MSDLITSAPVAGWYEDPYDDGQMRWWTGDEWSEHVAPMTPEATAAAQAADETSRRPVPSEATAAAAHADTAGAQADIARAEAERREAVRVEAARVEAAQVEAARVEAARVDAARAEAARAEAEAAQADALRAEAARAETARIAEEADGSAARAEPPRPAPSEAGDLLAQLAAAAAPSAEDDQPEDHSGQPIHDLGGEPAESRPRTRADLRAGQLADPRRQEQSPPKQSDSTTEAHGDAPVLERVLPPGVAPADAAPVTWSASSQAPSVSDLVIEPEIEPPASRTASTTHETAPLIATPITDETPVIASRRSRRDAAPIPELIITSEDTESDGAAVAPVRPSREEHLASLMAAAEKQVELQRLAQAELQAEADRQRGEQLHGRTGGSGTGVGVGTGVGAGQMSADTGAVATALPSEAPESPVLVPASTSTELARPGMVPLPGADDPFWSTAVVTPAATAVFSDEPKGAATLSSWLLALSPLLGVALVLGAGVAAALTVPGMTAPALALAAVLAILLPLVFVVADGRKLRSRGVATAPSALWWLLGPLVYLLVRAVRVRREGPRTWLPAAVHVGASLAAAGVVVVGSMSFLTPVVAAVAEPLVASSMMQSLAADGENWQIDCDGRIPSLAAGAEFTCPAASGADAGEVAGTFTDDRGAFSYRLTVED